MIFVTADTHGDMQRFEEKALKRLKKTDTLIVLGDFGFIWQQNSAQQKALKKLAKQPYRILFIDGLNEDFAQIMQYPLTEKFGGQVREIVKDKLFYIPRGQVLEIEGKKLLCFGGCDNYDMDIVTSSNDPDKNDFIACTENLAKHSNKVDYVLTHMPSGNINRFLNLDSNMYSECMDFFDAIGKYVQYEKWYFGCMHLDKFISTKAQAVYTQIIPLWNEEKQGFFKRKNK